MGLHRQGDAFEPLVESGDHVSRFAPSASRVSCAPSLHAKIQTERGPHTWHDKASRIAHLRPTVASRGPRADLSDVRTAEEL